VTNARLIATLAALVGSSPAMAFAQDYAPPPDMPPESGSSGGTGQVTASRRPEGGGNADILRPSSRPMWLVGGVGPNLYDLNFGGRPAPGRPNRDFLARVLITADFGYHFDGQGEGPAIGAALEQTVGQGLYTFNPAAKFWWDIEIADMAIYVAPWVKAGYLLGTAGGQLAHGFNLGFGPEGRVVLDDRWMLFARPGQVDLIFGDFYGDAFTANVSFVIGGGATF